MTLTSKLKEMAKEREAEQEEDSSSSAMTECATQYGDDDEDGRSGRSSVASNASAKAPARKRGSRTSRRGLKRLPKALSHQSSLGADNAEEDMLNITIGSGASSKRKRKKGKRLSRSWTGSVRGSMVGDDGVESMSIGLAEFVRERSESSRGSLAGLPHLRVMMDDDEMPLEIGTCSKAAKKKNVTSMSSALRNLKMERQERLRLVAEMGRRPSRARFRSLLVIRAYADILRVKKRMTRELRKALKSQDKAREARNNVVFSEEVERHAPSVRSSTSSSSGDYGDERSTIIWGGDPRMAINSYSRAALGKPLVEMGSWGSRTQFPAIISKKHLMPAEQCGLCVIGEQKRAPVMLQSTRPRMASVSEAMAEHRKRQSVLQHQPRKDEDAQQSQGKRPKSAPKVVQFVDDDDQDGELITEPAWTLSKMTSSGNITWTDDMEDEEDMDHCFQHPQQCSASTDRNHPQRPRSREEEAQSWRYKLDGARKDRLDHTAMSVTSAARGRHSVGFSSAGHSAYLQPVSQGAGRQGMYTNDFQAPPAGGHPKYGSNRSSIPHQGRRRSSNDDGYVSAGSSSQRRYSNRSDRWPRGGARQKKQVKDDPHAMLNIISEAEVPLDEVMQCLCDGLMLFQRKALGLEKHTPTPISSKPTPSEASGATAVSHGVRKILTPMATSFAASRISCATDAASPRFVGTDSAASSAAHQASSEGSGGPFSQLGATGQSVTGHPNHKRILPPMAMPCGGGIDGGTPTSRALSARDVGASPYSGMDVNEVSLERSLHQTTPPGTRRRLPPMDGQVIDPRNRRATATPSSNMTESPPLRFDDQEMTAFLAVCQERSLSGRTSSATPQSSIFDETERPTSSAARNVVRAGLPPLPARK